MQTKVLQYISRHALLAPGAPVLVALSGGADSVALLRLLVSLGYDVQAAHCNFQLRGDESRRDEDFVRNLCAELGVTLHVTRFDTAEYARRTAKSIEMAARDLRYGWFATFGRTVAVAHHQDDNAETVLLNLIRGTGIDGLAGIAPSRPLGDVQVIRPLLCVTRDEILHWLQAQGPVGRLPLYVTDSTNLEDEARRNVIRHHVMPLLRSLNPSIAATISDTACRMRDTAALAASALQQHVEDCCDGSVIDLGRLLAAPAPATILYTILVRHGFTGAQCDDIFRRIADSRRHTQQGGRPGATLTGRIFHSPTHRLLCDRGRLLLRANGDTPALLVHTLPAEGTVQVTNKLALSLSVHTAEGFVIPRDPHVACLDLDTLALPLTIRRVQAADRFTPFGMRRGSKLVSDYLTDRHASLFDKEDQLAVFSGESNSTPCEDKDTPCEDKGTPGHDIVWLVARCPSARHAVTPATSRVLCIRILP